MLISISQTSSENKSNYNKSFANINNLYENNIFGPLSLKYPLLFDITANKKPDFNTNELVKNAYNCYLRTYNVNEFSINNLLNNNNFKKDTEIIHIAVHNNTEYILNDIEEVLQLNTIYKEVFEFQIHDLRNLNNISDKIIEEVFNSSIEDEKKIDNILFLLKEIEKLKKKYY